MPTNNNNNPTRIGDQIPYSQITKWKSRDERYGIVIAIADKGEYNKILLDTGKTIYRVK
tara:strand:+ start:146 stop:322 length:177 start_codon:yes stop_codon:yes gene_type:complete